ncbi:MAG TPA: IS1595 family transposase [Terriglobales bacterium]|nr:IS1595 family transposase [Terriglobales bacterium]
MASEPTTLVEAIRYFAEFENCKAFMMALRWPDGKVTCPRCGSEKVTWLANAKLWKCYGGHPVAKFSLKTGTIFEDSPLPLDKWITATWLIVNCKNGVSSYEVARDIGISQKSAWHMDHRIRHALREGSFTKLSGNVEVDESFIGGKARNMHASKRATKITGTGGKDKTIVMGMVERDGKVRAMVVEKRRKKELQKQIREHIEAGSAIFSDELKSYDGLSEDYKHAVINHAVEYVNGHVHTNTMENFWSLLKRSLHGTYISVEPYHLARYIDEQMFRYNNRRGLKDFDRFKLAMSQIVGRRLTWNQLTGKTPEPNPSLN